MLCSLEHIHVPFILKHHASVVLPSCLIVVCLLQALIQDKSFRKWVELYAKDQDKFFDDFAAAYQKLLHLGVPVNNPGQHAPA